MFVCCDDFILQVNKYFILFSPVNSHAFYAMYLFIKRFLREIVVWESDNVSML